MRLEIFDFIDETIGILEEKKVMLRESSKEILHFFEDHFLPFDNVINISSRIKSTKSIKEKVLRQDFYLKYKTPENLIGNLSDLIGVRLECRFIEDEEDVYRKILKFFNEEDEDLEGYFYNKNNQDLLLKLSDKQPQTQKNGFYIYKIDGLYRFGEININFELQVKSMVNVFWGEVEHKILYKNYRYLLTEDLFKDMMDNLMESLIMIDKQLMTLNNHLVDIDSSSREQSRAQIERILSKIIYEIYSEMTKKEFGFVIDYRKVCDIIISYVLREDRFSSSDSNFVEIMEKISHIGEDEISFGDHIEIESDIDYEDHFSEVVGESILSVINKDFKWNIFFKIISELETGRHLEDFKAFVYYTRDCFLDNLLDNEDLLDKFDEEERLDIINYIMGLIARNFQSKIKIEFISKENVDAINENVNTVLSKVTCYSMWRENIGYFTSEMNMDMKL